ncbi:hypothetical protein ACFQE7_31975 [Nonomuraea ferruginea]
MSGTHHHASISTVLVARFPTSPIATGIATSATGDAAQRLPRFPSM